MLARAQLFSLRSAAGSVRAAHARCITLAVSRPRLLALRSSRSSLSSSSSSSTSTSTSSANVAQQAAAEEDALMLTPVQKVAAGFRLSMYGGLFVLASTCGYFVVMYLFPTRMSPQGAFNSALEFVRRDERVIARFGEPLKGYGRDLNTRSEGRRNFIDSKEYVAKDGSKRLRIKFTIEGPGNAKGNVWAEISDKMRSDEWVYVMVQDRRTGKLDTLIDKRMEMEAYTGATTDAEREALAGLLGRSR